MSISSAWVASRGTILAQTRMTDDVRGVVSRMMERLPQYDSRTSYAFGDRVYHFLVENEIVYAGSTAAEYSNMHVYTFLDAVKKSFRLRFAGSEDAYPRSSTLSASRCSSFATALDRLIADYNTEKSGDMVVKVKDEMAAAKQVMLENLDSLLGRGERITAICAETEVLRDGSRGFYSNSRSMRFALLRHNVIIAVIFILVLGVLALIIAMTKCGADFSAC